jgi:hypothetical protein
LIPFAASVSPQKPTRPFKLTKDYYFHLDFHKYQSVRSRIAVPVMESQSPEGPAYLFIGSAGLCSLPVNRYAVSVPRASVPRWVRHLSYAAILQPHPIVTLKSLTRVRELSAIGTEELSVGITTDISV